jgi:hypothetical protein
LSEEQQERNADRDLRRFKAWIANGQATRDQQSEQLGDSESESYDDDVVADPTFVDSSRPLAPAPSPFAPASCALVPVSSASSALAPAYSAPSSAVPLTTSGIRARCCI